MSLRTVAAGLLAATAAVTVPAAPAAADVTGPVVLVGTGGVRWDDVSPDTPALAALRDSDAIGVLAVRSVRSTACPVDGWLAVSAGRRAGDTDPVTGQPACRAPEVAVPAAGGAATVPRWGEYLRAADEESFEASPGVLARATGTARTAAVGAGAAVALADAAGQVAHAWKGLPSTVGVDPSADPTVLLDDVKAALATNPRLLVVDVGALRTDGPAGSPAARVGRTAQVSALDERLGLVLGELPASATVVVASLADSDAEAARLQLVAARGPAVGGLGRTAGTYANALLGSRSTRQDGMAQTTDLLPTLLLSLSLPVPDDAVGSPLVPLDGGDQAARRDRVLDLDLAAQAVHPIVPWFFNGLVIAQILLYGVATQVLRRRSPDPVRRGRILGLLRRAAVVFACVPAATFLANLVPWWRAGLPWVAVTAAVVGFVVPMALVALLGPWRDHPLGPLGVVGGITAAVLAADVATGSHLMLSSLMGVQPVVAGRFYGFSNPGFALFATGCLLLAILLADVVTRRRGPRAGGLLVAGVGLLATVVDGTPGLGSDFGGPPAIIPAFAVLALLVAGTRMTWQRALLVAAVTVGVLTLISVGDWLRPAGDRTHLGRFVQTVLDGGAWPVVQRKGAQNLRILTHSWLSLLLPFAVAFVVLVLARPVSWGVRPLQLAYDRAPALRHGLLAFAVLVGLGFALNDSGTAIPAVAATVAIPLLIAASVRALELDDRERRDARAARVRRDGARPPRRRPPRGRAASTAPRSDGTRA